MDRDELRTLILNAASDAGTDLVFYDRKEDEDLHLGMIEQAIADGVITVDEIVEEFRQALL